MSTANNKSFVGKKGIQRIIELLFGILKKKQDLMEEDLVTKGTFRYLLTGEHDTEIRTVGNYTALVDHTDKTVTLKRYNGSETEVVVPAIMNINNESYAVQLGDNQDQSSSSTDAGLFSYYPNITSITFESGIKMLSGYEMFRGCKLLTSIDLSTVDASECSDMSGMFNMANSNTLTSIIFGDNYDTSRVTSMIKMFYNCTGLQSLDLSTFDTSECTSMSEMFYKCTALTSITFGEKFNTSKVKDMQYMFYKCSGLTEIDLNRFDTSNVTSLFRMFNDCSKLTSLDLSTFDTNECTDMAYLFSGCEVLTDIKISDKFVTDNVTNMGNMFGDCKVLPGDIINSIVSKFNTSKVTNLSGMFTGCESLIELDISGFDTTECKSMASMFHMSQSLRSITFGDKWDTSKVTNMQYMFGSTKIESFDASKIDTSACTHMSNMFSYNSAVTELDLSTFDTSNCTDMLQMFNVCMNLQSITFGDKWDTSKVTQVTSMFAKCTSLTTLDLTSFDTRNMKSMGYMFRECSALTEIKVTEGKWVVPDSATNMFDGCAIDHVTYA